MKQTTKLYFIIAGLCALLVVREIKHTQRAYNAHQYAEQAQKDAFERGFSACMGQF